MPVMLDPRGSSRTGAIDTWRRGARRHRAGRAGRGRRPRRPGRGARHCRRDVGPEHLEVLTRGGLQSRHHRIGDVAREEDDLGVVVRPPGAMGQHELGPGPRRRTARSSRGTRRSAEPPHRCGGRPGWRLSSAIMSSAPSAGGDTWSKIQSMSSFGTGDEAVERHGQEQHEFDPMSAHVKRFPAGRAARPCPSRGR